MNSTFFADNRVGERVCRNLVRLNLKTRQIDCHKTVLTFVPEFHVEARVAKKRLANHIMVFFYEQYLSPSASKRRRNVLHRVIFKLNLRLVRQSDFFDLPPLLSFRLFHNLKIKLAYQKSIWTHIYDEGKRIFCAVFSHNIVDLEQITVGGVSVDESVVEPDYRRDVVERELVVWFSSNLKSYDFLENKVIFFTLTTNSARKQGSSAGSVRLTRNLASDFSASEMAAASAKSDQTNVLILSVFGNLSKLVI